MPERRVAHLDMDAFYASVELRRHPELEGLPLVIGGRPRGPRGEPLRLRDYVGRGVVTTANYAARTFGVHSALGLMKAAQRCPQALLLPADFEEYRRCSREFKRVIAGLAPQIEDRGIDEVYIEFTTAPGGQEQGGRPLALAIQQAVRERTGLGCSIGVAPNKLLAKIASELNKPAGITILYARELEQRIWPLECRRINGIGPKTALRLERLGIATIRQLAACERGWLQRQFGARHGAWMHEAAWGQDERPVVTHSEPVSMSRETTFDRDLSVQRDRDRLRAIFGQLCERLARDLQDSGYLGRTVGVKVRFADFRLATRECTLQRPTDEAALIRHTAARCLARAPLDRPLRLLGVRAGGLVRHVELQQLTPRLL